MSYEVKSRKTPDLRNFFRKNQNSQEFEKRNFEIEEPVSLHSPKQMLITDLYKKRSFDYVTLQNDGELENERMNHQLEQSHQSGI